jgi:hypothetical protein
MKKKNYIKPTVKVIVLRHQSALLVGSGEGGDDPQSKEPEVPSEAPNAIGFDGWLG